MGSKWCRVPVTRVTPRPPGGHLITQTHTPSCTVLPGIYSRCSTLFAFCYRSSNLSRCFQIFCFLKSSFIQVKRITSSMSTNLRYECFYTQRQTLCYVQLHITHFIYKLDRDFGTYTRALGMLY